VARKGSSEGRAREEAGVAADALQAGERWLYGRLRRDRWPQSLHELAREKPIK